MMENISKFPYEINGTVNYESYEDTLDRIKNFSGYSVLGNDSSGMYNLHKIEFGSPKKPTIFVMASIHGSEWQATQYSLSFFEMLRDKTFPDKDFQTKLLGEYHIVYIPIGNPWGYANTTKHSRLKGRNNVNNVNLNRDFGNFTQVESQIIRNEAILHRPFVYIDLHLIAPRRDGGQNYCDISIGNSQRSTDIIRDDMLKIMSFYAKRKTSVFESNLKRGTTRHYFKDITNPFTPITLAYVSELYRPVNDGDGPVAYLTDEEIYEFGIVQLYWFFKTSMGYFEERIIQLE
ncbi:M14 family zinc carboxypeptidase [Alkalihalobacillus sp. LMS39]|uniref:M14 family zinc carboxypeptidase n=1 Tax=Alkalihalobacillus sp. LMS39 TaxID=2924032 RepID=UPI001FB38CB6|nr:M14 family zinc carboxypeptidase [Alkalihalobacillus sp. LMS39]UOE93519.1 hypothetical protein MM271_20390 [Alkalihalobacillus sp. LMS39]